MAVNAAELQPSSTGRPVCWVSSQMWVPI